MRRSCSLKGTFKTFKYARTRDILFYAWKSHSSSHFDQVSMESLKAEKHLARELRKPSSLLTRKEVCDCVNTLVCIQAVIITFLPLTTSCGMPKPALRFKERSRQRSMGISRTSSPLFDRIFAKRSIRLQALSSH
ncbi:hypothetical protein P692DRAFT_20201690 [Suillus brevipes Sb2]|nr:hypothetical protein P692DRAFT_20201690 [Suillus brevipes Sb2]